MWRLFHISLLDRFRMSRRLTDLFELCPVVYLDSVASPSSSLRSSCTLFIVFRNTDVLAHGLVLGIIHIHIRVVDWSLLVSFG